MKDDTTKKQAYLKRYKKQIEAGDVKTPSYAQYMAAQTPVYLKGFEQESYESRMKAAGMTTEEIGKFKTKKLSRKK
jgi:hypothetical protein